MVEIEGLTDLVEIGRGGFGVVYRATQPAFRRQVAVKVLSDRLDSANQARFEREGAAMGSLSGHPNILVLHGSGLTRDGRPFLLMPFLGRGSLGARLENAGPLPWQEVLAVGVRVAGALDTAHAAGILHRDIKPDNILIDDYGEPQLCDFGIARFHRAGGTATASGTVNASVLYAAVEVLGGGPASERSDVYGLGATLYALLAGRPAFFVQGEESLAPFFYRVTTEPLPALAGIPDPVAAPIATAMAKEPADRPSSAAALGEALQAAQRSLSVPVTTLPLPGSPAAPSRAGNGAPPRADRLGPTRAKEPTPADAGGASGTRGGRRDPPVGANTAPESGGEATVVGASVSKVAGAERGTPGATAAGPDTPAVVTSRPQRRMGGLIGAGVGILVALGVGGAWWATRGGGDDGSEPPQSAATEEGAAAAGDNPPAAVGASGLDDGVLRIGLVLPAGVPPLDPATPALVRAAAEAAVEDVNVAGGVLGGDVELEVVDGGTGDAQLTAVTALLERPVDVLLAGDPTVDAAALTTLVADAGRLLISPLATSLTLGADDRGLVFRTALPERLDGLAMAEDISGRAFETVLIVEEETAFGTAAVHELESRLRARGYEVSVIGFAPGDVEDLSAEIAGAAPADCLAVAASADLGAVLRIADAAVSPGWTVLPPAAIVAGRLDPDLAAVPLVDVASVVGRDVPDDILLRRLGGGPPQGVRPTYDAVVLAALAALAAADDGALDMAGQLPELTRGETATCRTFADCSAALGSDVDYEPPERPLDLDDGGDPQHGGFRLFAVRSGGELEHFADVDTSQH